MNDLSLLVFGTAVTFIGVAGAYVYIRECFTRAEQVRQRVAERKPAPRAELRDVA